MLATVLQRVCDCGNPSHPRLQQRTFKPLMGKHWEARWSKHWEEKPRWVHWEEPRWIYQRKPRWSYHWEEAAPFWKDQAPTTWRVFTNWEEHAPPWKESAPAWKRSSYSAAQLGKKRTFEGHSTGSAEQPAHQEANSSKVHQRGSKRLKGIQRGVVKKAERGKAKTKGFQRKRPLSNVAYLRSRQVLQWYEIHEADMVVM